MRRHILSLALLSGLALGLAAPAGGMPTIRADGTVVVPALARTTATWTRAVDGPPIIWEATAFAASTCSLVSFGGLNLPTGTRLFDPAAGAWTTVPTPRRGPAARAHARMAWDPVHSRVVMFGGRNNAGSLQDTWAFDPVAKTWTRLVRPCHKGGRCALPPARHAHGMVWSSAIGRIVMFGGERTDGRTGAELQLDDVWTFDGAAWQQMATNAGPSPRSLFGMAEDAATGNIVVYGGIGQYAMDGGSSTEPVRDASTWVLDPRTGTWTEHATATVPEMRVYGGMAWVASLGAVVLATGATEDPAGATFTSSAWAFDVAAGNWRRLTTSGAVPTARVAASLTANTCDGSAILNGGSSTGDLLKLATEPADRTWILE